MHPEPAIEIGAHLQRIEDKLDWLIRLSQHEVHAMATALDSLADQVSANTQVETSAIQMIQGLADQLRQAGTDPAKIAQLQQSLDQSASRLAAAITANTPVAAGNGGNSGNGQGSPGTPGNAATGANLVGSGTNQNQG